ncbi:DUF1643 domain-containing protein [Biomphalaria pfeifferi]|uniref:DUF1643 domain-containing protein n=1 Tax=Biomphalaria pfeifferi TaxID=112525 RepID=A0AAD8AQ59_BIOPF|nr:DUF1643 domain-containing protein [Biomphalaria pfeifferi]
MTHDPGGKRKPPWPTNSTVQAHFSDCGLYRYSLSEIWDPARPLVMFLLMNPSVAGIQHADPTLIKTGKYARAWGYGGQLIGNVHAYRATDSSHLVDAADPVGPLNDQALLEMAGRASAVILAYGLPPKPLRARAAHVLEMLRRVAPLKYLQLTKDGTPSHPLYLRDVLRPLSFPA